MGGGGPSGRTLSKNTKKTQDRTALCFKTFGFWPWFLDPIFWTLVFGPWFLSLVFGPSPLLPSDFAGASHFQLVHIHKIKSKWSLVILLCSRQIIRINLR